MRLLNCEKYVRCSPRFALTMLIILTCLALYTQATQSLQPTLSGCVRGEGCSQCPAARYTQAHDGSLLCCPSCAPAALYHGEAPSSWCVCYIGAPPNNEFSSKTLSFPSESGRPRPRPSSGGGTREGGKVINTPHGNAFQDTMYIINDAGGSNSAVGSLPRSVQRALTLLADTVENLHARVSRMENIIFATHGTSDRDNIDRVGVVTGGGAGQGTVQGAAAGAGAAAGSGRRPCHNANFTRMGDRCYYSSAAHPHRAVWKDARDACDRVGSKLTEPLTRGQFVDLIQYLALRPAATGFSYWIGGVYPGVSWRWAYAGEEVTLAPSYWTGEDAAGQKMAPGDTNHGLCLSFTYLVKAETYYFAPDQCGYEKYFVCELLEHANA